MIFYVVTISKKTSKPIKRVYRNPKKVLKFLSGLTKKQQQRVTIKEFRF